MSFHYIPLHFQVVSSLTPFKNKTTLGGNLKGVLSTYAEEGSRGENPSEFVCLEIRSEFSMQK